MLVEEVREPLKRVENVIVCIRSLFAFRFAVRKTPTDDTKELGMYRVRHGEIKQAVPERVVCYHNMVRPPAEK